MTDTLTEAELRKKIADLETENNALKAAAASFEQERAAWTAEENKLNRFIAKNLVASSEDPDAKKQPKTDAPAVETEEDLAKAYKQAISEAEKAHEKK